MDLVIHAIYTIVFVVVLIGALVAYADWKGY